MQLISTDLLKTRFQLRVSGIITELADEYAEAMADGYGNFPPIVVSKIDGDYCVIDGHHRLEAAKRNRLEEVPCDVIESNSTAALVEAFVRNNRQGMRFSKADRENAILIMLQAFSDHSDKYIAKLIGVSNATIGRYRNKLEASQKVQDITFSNENVNNETEKHIGADGKARGKRHMPTEEYEPEPEPETTDAEPEPLEPSPTFPAPSVEVKPKRESLRDAGELTITKDLEPVIIAAKLWAFLDGNNNPSKIHDIASTLEDRLING